MVFATNDGQVETSDALDGGASSGVALWGAQGARGIFKIIPMLFDINLNNRGIACTLDCSAKNAI